MKKILIAVSITIIVIAVCFILVPYLIGYKIVYLSEVSYDFEAIMAFGQWVGILIPILLVFLSAYVTKKFNDSKNEVANSNVATIEYIDEVKKEIDKKINGVFQQSSTVEDSEEQKLEKLKRKVFKFVSISMVTSTKAVASHLNVTKEEAFNILEELLLVDGLISCGGSARKENMDNVVWTKKKR